MIKIVSLLTLLILIFNINIQAQIILSGQVKDKHTNENIEFCNVTVLNKNDSIIINTATNEKGFFFAEIKKGSYKLLFSYIGFRNDTTNLQRISKSKFSGIFKLEKDNNELEEVIINAETTEIRTDKDIIIITNRLKIGATNTKDILNKLNGVYYNYHSKTITVDGENNVMLLVNGLEKNNEYIKNLSPDRLRKIEIIREPDGKYGIQGYSAVINIVLKQNYQGTELFIYNNNESNPFKKNKAEICAINNFYTSLNYTKNKINIYGLISNNYKNLYDPTSIKKEYSSGLIQNNVMIKKNNFTYRSLTNYYTIGLDYYINPKHVLSFESNLNSFPASNDIRDENYKVTKTINTTVLDEYITENNTNSENKYYRNTMFYKYIINQKNTLNADFSYTYYIDSYKNYHTEINRFKNTEKGKNIKSNTILYVNFKHKISNRTSFRLGYGNINTYIENTNTIVTKDLIHKINNDTNNSLKYTDIRHHFYSYFSWKPTKKIGIKIGGVLETNIPKSEDIQDIRYYSIQPYLDVKYKPFKKIVFRLKYRTKTRYPSIVQLNPFTKIIDKQTIFKGNINLKPLTIHKISIRSDFFRNKASIEPYYYYSNNYISKSATLTEDTIVEYTYLNVGKYSKVGLKANFTIPFSESLSLQSTFNFFESTIKDIEINNSFFDWITSHQLTYFNKKMNLQVALTYQKYMHKYIKGYGYVKANDDFWLITAQKNFLNKKLNITLAYYLPINFGVDYNQSYYTATPNYTSERITNIGDVIKNYIMLTISYNFNKGKNIRKTKKKVKEEREFKPNE